MSIRRKKGLNRYTVVTRNKAPEKVSKKQAKKNREYTEAERKFLDKNPVCMIQREGCHYHAVWVHHPKGRGEHLCNSDLFIGTCDSENCHGWIESHPEEAKELSFSQDRLTKDVIPLPDKFKELQNKFYDIEYPE